MSMRLDSVLSRTYLVIACAALGVTIVAVSQRTTWRDRLSTTARADPSLPRALKSGTELVAVFIGSSTCGAAENPELKVAIAQLRRSLAARAFRDGKTFSSIGVALDWSVRDGLQFLATFGEFDEVMAGRNWLNAGAVHYIWRDIAGRPSLPQVLLLERSVEVTATSISIGDETLIARKVGAGEITQWVASLAP